jgi:hypothetical protein
MLSTARWVAPSARHASTSAGHSASGTLFSDILASMPTSPGRRPALLDLTAEVGDPPASASARPCGNQPSATRAARATATSAVAPIQTGIGRWTGIGFSPASVTVWSLPVNVTTSSVQSRRISAICSSSRRPRVWNDSPSASYSTAFHPMPTPSRNLPPVRTSTSAACFATSAVCRCGRMTTPVTSSRPGAQAAR